MKWCKMATDFDENPKVVAAGILGRDLFLFLVRLNARRRGEGVIPESYMDLDYLARQWGGSHDQVLEALADATTAGLVERMDDGSYALIGWSREEWGMPLTGAERAANFRKKRAESNGAQPMRTRAGASNRFRSGDLPPLTEPRC